MREVGQVRRSGGGRWRLVVSLALKSLLNRRLTAGLTVLSVAVSVALVVGVDRVRTETKASFARTISGADLIVGARGGPLNLLLYSIFRIGRTGDATSGISWESYQVLAARPEVAWTIPLSLGDAHRGFRVLGTNLDYFTHYRFGRGQQIAFATGQPFADAEDAVLGAEGGRGPRLSVGRCDVWCPTGLAKSAFVITTRRLFMWLACLPAPARQSTARYTSPLPAWNGCTANPKGKTTRASMAGIPRPVTTRASMAGIPKPMTTRASMAGIPKPMTTRASMAGIPKRVIMRRT